MGTLDSTNITLDAIDVEAINDTADGQAWETLREMGYEVGDKVVIRDSILSQSFQSTTSDTFVPVGGRTDTFIIDWSLLQGFDDGSVYLRMLPDIDQSGSTTVTFRVAEVDRYGNIQTTYADTEITGGGDEATPWHQFDALPTGQTVHLGAFLSSNGTDDAYARRTQLQLGVEI
jgi:hypothetical protein